MINTFFAGLKDLGGIVSAVLVILTFLGVIIPKFRNFFISVIKSASKSDEFNDKIDNLTKEMKATIDVVRETQCKLCLLEEANLCQLMKNIREMCKDIIDKKSISEEEYKMISRSHEIYKKLGGNSFIDNLVHQALKTKLEISKEI